MRGHVTLLEEVNEFRLEEILMIDEKIAVGAHSGGDRS